MHTVPSLVNVPGEWSYCGADGSCNLGSLDVSAESSCVTSQASDTSWRMGVALVALTAKAYNPSLPEDGWRAVVADAEDVKVDLGPMM